MDVTLLPPSAILSNHSHQICHQSPMSSSSPSIQPAVLLPSPMCRRNWSHFVPPKLMAMSGFHTYRYRRRAFEPALPVDGSSPISQLPDEVWLEVLKYLNWQELFATRTVDSRLSRLALTSNLHHSLAFSSLPPLPLPSILTEYLLPSVRHLRFHLFPYPSSNSAPVERSLVALLRAIPPGQLRTLSLPFTSPYISSTEIGDVLKVVGGKLEKLDLRGSAISGRKWIEWIPEVGKNGPGVKELDLGFTFISSLPGLTSPKPNESDLDPFRNIDTISLVSCSYLPSSCLHTFLTNLPPSLVSLDLSRLEQIPFASLWEMKVTHRPTPSSRLQPTALTNIKLVGIDHLTRTDIRRLKRHWESQRRSCLSVNSGFWGQEIEGSPSRLWGGTASSGTGLPLTPPRTPTRSRSPMSGQFDLGNVISASNRLQWSTGTSPTSTSFQPTSLLTPPPSISPPLPPRAPFRLQESHTSYDTISINITHSAILESEDEAGYRQFIGEVAGALVDTSMLWTGGETGPLQPSVTLNHEAAIEVDEGGMM